METFRKITPLIISFCILQDTHAQNSKDSTPNAPTLTPIELAQKKASQLLIQTKTFDPFGLNQDPNAIPVLVTPRNTPQIKPKQPKIALQKEILKLKSKINGIGPNRMLIGPKTYRRNSLLDVEAAGKTFNLKIMKITTTEVHFKNLGDNAILTLDMKRNKTFITESGPQTFPGDANDTIKLTEE